MAKRRTRIWAMRAAPFVVLGAAAWAGCSSSGGGELPAADGGAEVVLDSTVDAPRPDAPAMDSDVGRDGASPFEGGDEAGGPDGGGARLDGGDAGRPRGEEDAGDGGGARDGGAVGDGGDAGDAQAAADARTNFDASGDPIDARVPGACDPHARTGFDASIAYKPPSGLHQGLCTAADIHAFTTCFSSGFSADGCDPYKPGGDAGATLAKCIACAVTDDKDDRAATWGPLVFRADRKDSENVAGCIGQLKGDTSTRGCAKAVATAIACSEYTCRSVADTCFGACKGEATGAGWPCDGDQQTADLLCAPDTDVSACFDRERLVASFCGP